ncbi:hypothetical protein WOLCODRAFT_156295 [Wolfiporia cocos MD-104 SS10]|uniref:Uncharacterized protein n=1 Tax=Wolfiporia cocos (strain MD-104) TaxID=742152 RepID=A0A2H3J1M8_WOLCO|nr:hypothetical protein WOLCODRAFT_156295 [Wolfiporia cocos MD-104 SS10]
MSPEEPSRQNETTRGDAEKEVRDEQDGRIMGSTSASARTSRLRRQPMKNVNFEAGTALEPKQSSNKFAEIFAKRKRNNLMTFSLSKAMREKWSGRRSTEAPKSIRTSAGSDEFDVGSSRASWSCDRSTEQEWGSEQSSGRQSARQSQDLSVGHEEGPFALPFRGVEPNDQCENSGEDASDEAEEDKENTHKSLGVLESGATTKGSRRILRELREMVDGGARLSTDIDGMEQIGKQNDIDIAKLRSGVKKMEDKRFLVDTHYLQELKNDHRLWDRSYSWHAPSSRPGKRKAEDTKGDESGSPPRKSPRRAAEEEGGSAVASEVEGGTSESLMPVHKLQSLPGVAGSKGPHVGMTFNVGSPEGPRHAHLEISDDKNNN